MKRSTKHEKKPPSASGDEEARTRTKVQAMLDAVERQDLRDKALDSLRTVAWFRALCEMVGVHGFRASDLENHWLRFGAKTEDLSHIDWRPYARGSQRPSEKTLHLVETHYPGLRRIYEQGELDLWAILRGDIDACTAAVNEQVAMHTKEPHLIEFGMSVSAKLEHFKSMLIAPELMTTYDPVGHLLMGRSGKNPVALSYFWACSDDPAMSAKGKMISPGLAVATIALSQLATAYRDSFWIADYLMLGLCRHALKDQFPAIGELLGEFVMALMAWRDTGSLKMPGPSAADEEGR